MVVKVYNCANTKRTANDTPTVPVHPGQFMQHKRQDYRAEVFLHRPNNTCSKIQIATITCFMLIIGTVSKTTLSTRRGQFFQLMFRASRGRGGQFFQLIRLSSGNTYQLKELYHVLLKASSC